MRKSESRLNRDNGDDPGPSFSAKQGNFQRKELFMTPESEDDEDSGSEDEDNLVQNKLPPNAVSIQSHRGRNSKINGSTLNPGSSKNVESPITSRRRPVSQTRRAAFSSALKLPGNQPVALSTAHQRSFVPPLAVPPVPPPKFRFQSDSPSVARLQSDTLFAIRSKSARFPPAVGLQSAFYPPVDGHQPGASFTVRTPSTCIPPAAEHQSNTTSPATGFQSACPPSGLQSSFIPSTSGKYSVSSLRVLPIQGPNSASTWIPPPKPRWVPPPRTRPVLSEKPSTTGINSSTTLQVSRRIHSPPILSPTVTLTPAILTSLEQELLTVPEILEAGLGSDAANQQDSDESIILSSESESDSTLSSQRSGESSENNSWEWNNNNSLAETVPFEFLSELSFVDIPTGDDIELKCFLEFFTDEILEIIVDESNKYFEEATRRKSSMSRRDKTFKSFTTEDILRMVATRICMGIDQKPTQASYWSKSSFYKSDIIPRIMTSDRYREVMQYLHFCDNSAQQPGDRIHKIRQVWNLFNERLGFFCNPGKNICVDESLVGFKGNLGFRQYIPSKAAKVGIKLFCIGDSESGYILSAVIYEGKGHRFDYSTKEFGFGGAVALHLAAPYVNFGRCLFADNFFINPRIAKQLLSLKTNVCGTVRKNLKLNPNMKDKMKKGTVNVYSSNGILVERWRDKKEVCVMSTGHDHQMISVRTRCAALKQKPSTVLEYNRMSKVIDKMDMVTGTYDLNRKCSKWYKKLFFKMLDICLYNANIMFGRKHGAIPILEFKERVVRQILKKYGEHDGRRGRKPSEKRQKRLTERHFLDYLPATEKKGKPSRNCAVCKENGIRRGTRFMCPDCNVPLCHIPCFKIYHTQ